MIRLPVKYVETEYDGIQIVDASGEVVSVILTARDAPGLYPLSLIQDAKTIVDALNRSTQNLSAETKQRIEDANTFV